MKKFIVVFFVLFSNFSFAAYCQCGGTGSVCWPSLDAAIAAHNPKPLVYTLSSIRSTWAQSSSCTGYNVWFATSQGNIDYERPDHSVVFYLSGAPDPTPTPNPNPCQSKAGQSTGRNYYSFGTDPNSNPSVRCAGGCVAIYSGTGPIVSQIVNGKVHYYGLGEYTYTADQCTGTDGPTSIGTDKANNATCPENKVLTYVNDKAYCYTPASTPAPNTTPPSSTASSTASRTEATTTSTSETSTKTNADGSTTTTTKTTNSDGSTTTTSTTTFPDGSKKTTTTETAKAENDANKEEKEPGECSKPDMKNTIGCQTVNVKPGDKSKFEIDKEKSKIDEKRNEFKTEIETIRNNLKIKLGATVSAAGSPKSYAFSVFDGTTSVDLADYQAMYSKIAVMVLAIAHIVAVFIILS